MVINQDPAMQGAVQTNNHKTVLLFRFLLLILDLAMGGLNHFQPAWSQIGDISPINSFFVFSSKTLIWVLVFYLSCLVPLTTSVDLTP